jgi:hypothetical protein
MDAVKPLGWWTISGEALLQTYAEQYANSDHEHYE